jgi:hypothetical protein
MLKVPFKKLTQDVFMVVAKYKEDVRWAHQKFIPYKIYDKKNEMTNVGRESDTYLRHIIENYDNLPDYTIFLQGSPFPHTKKIVNSKTIIDTIVSHKYKNGYEMFYPKMLQKNKRRINIPRHYGPWGWIELGEFYDKWFYPTKEEFTTSGFGAQFIISRDCILFRSKDFYSEIIKCVNYEINPLEGYFMERLWPTIFDRTTKDKITHC